MTKNTEHSLALPVGTELVGDYVITKVLGAGGFGITYEANERSLDRTVAIKEFFPIDIVERQGWALVKARSTQLDMKYARGLRRFIEEAKTITQFNHPNIVRVLRYFKTNNTAFMVLHYEEGVDMGVWRENLRKPPTQNQLAGIINPLFDALSLIHSNDFLHRDIAPDNIIIRKDGSPILIDFGSARSDLTFAAKTVSALVKSGYSPFEQYAKNSKEQGPWTDIYSFGATLYQMVTGEAPPDSLSRLADDEMIPATGRSKKYYSRDFLAAIDSALAIKIADRPQSIEEWRSMLFPAGNTPEIQTPATQNQQTPIITDPAAIVPSPLAFEAHTQAQMPQPGGLLYRAGQSSVAGLIKKAGLKPADISDNAAKLAAKVKGPLRKLVAHGSNRNAKTPGVASLEADNEPKNHRSLRSLLNELDHRHEDGEHELIIENVANQPAPADPQGQSALPRITKGRELIINTRQALKKNSLSILSGKKKWLVALTLLGVFAWTTSAYKTDLTKLADKVELPQVIKSPVDLFSTGDAALIKTISAHDDGVTFLGLSSNGDKLISTGADRLIKLWSVADGGHIHSFKTDGQTVTTVDIDDTRLIQADDNGKVSLLYFGAPQQLISFFMPEGKVHSIAFAGRGNDVVTGGSQGRLGYWKFKDGQYSSKSFRGQGHSKSIRVIASHKRYIVTGSADHTAKIWGRSRKRLIRTYRGHDGPVNALALSPKAYRLATGSSDDRIKIWSPRSRRVRRTISSQQGGVLSLAFAYNGKWLASGGADHSIKIWNARNGRHLRTLIGHTANVRALVFSKNGNRLMSAGDDETIRFWDWRVPRKKN